MEVVWKTTKWRRHSDEFEQLQPEGVFKISEVAERQHRHSHITASNWHSTIDNWFLTKSYRMINNHGVAEKSQQMAFASAAKWGSFQIFFILVWYFLRHGRKLLLLLINKTSWWLYKSAHCCSLTSKWIIKQFTTIKSTIQAARTMSACMMSISSTMLNTIYQITVYHTPTQLTAYLFHV